MSDANVCVSEEEFSVKMIDSGQSLGNAALMSSKVNSPRTNSGDLEILKGESEMMVNSPQGEALASTQAILATPMSIAHEH